jgi:hypothetical protein
VAKEAPNSKHQIPNKFKIPSSNDRNSLEFVIWKIGNYLGFGICELGFEIGMFPFRGNLRETGG